MQWLCNFSGFFLILVIGMWLIPVNFFPSKTSIYRGNLATQSLSMQIHLSKFKIRCRLQTEISAKSMQSQYYIRIFIKKTSKLQQFNSVQISLTPRDFFQHLIISDFREIINNSCVFTCRVLWNANLSWHLKHRVYSTSISFLQKIWDTECNTYQYLSIIYIEEQIKLKKTPYLMLIGEVVWTGSRHNNDTVASRQSMAFCSIV